MNISGNMGWFRSRTGIPLGIFTSFAAVLGASSFISFFSIFASRFMMSAFPLSEPPNRELVELPPKSQEREEEADGLGGCGFSSSSSSTSFCWRMQRQADAES